MKTVLHTLALLVFVLVSQATGQDKALPEKAKDKPKTGAAAYDRFPEPLRSQLVKGWEQELEAGKRAIKDHQERLRRAKTVKERQRYERLITASKGELAKLEKNEPPNWALPQLSVTKIKVGEIYKTDGGLPNGAESYNTWGKILQVIDDDNMLVGIDNGREGNNPRYFVTVWCKFSTKGLTDGKTGFLATILGTDKVTVSGTTRYKTPAGGSRTVFVLTPLATKAIENPPKKPAETVEPAKNASQASRFVGRWKLVDEKGVVSSFLTVTKLGATRDHAPDSPGTWEVVGNEARIKWDDGFRDILRLDKDGKMSMLALQKAGPAEATNWSGPPRFRLQAVRIDASSKPAKMK